ncbi:MAG: hypothetical protein KKD38_08320 [Candidatus Delongbacteria bacterium]|nr:hypothetical protein [Candidatus Delongbacteria bacterium]
MAKNDKSKALRTSIGLISGSGSFRFIRCKKSHISELFVAKSLLSMYIRYEL